MLPLPQFSTVCPSMRVKDTTLLLCPDDRLLYRGSDLLSNHVVAFTIEVDVAGLRGTLGTNLLPEVITLMMQAGQGLPPAGEPPRGSEDGGKAMRSGARDQRVGIGCREFSKLDLRG